MSRIKLERFVCGCDCEMCLTGHAPGGTPPHYLHCTHATEHILTQRARWPRPCDCEECRMPRKWPCPCDCNDCQAGHDSPDHHGAGLPWHVIRIRPGERPPEWFGKKP